MDIVPRERTGSRIPNGDQKKTSLNGDHKNSPGIEKVELVHAPPGPAYDGLTTNVSTNLQVLKNYPWPEGNEQFVNVRVCGEYLQSYSRKFSIEQVTKYNTRVEHIEKTGEKWRVESTTLVTNGPKKGDRISNVDVSVFSREG
jgi:hypothetical protein